MMLDFKWKFQTANKIYMHRLNNREAPAAQRAAKHSSLPIGSTSKGNQWIHFLMVIMASGIARGRVRMTVTTTVEPRNMAAMLQLIHVD